jgi:hypothetical protein
MEGMALKASVFVLCVVLASTTALAGLGISVAPAPLSQLPKQIPPYVVGGLVYEADGVTPAVDCAVNVTNKNSGQWILTTTDPIYGWYEANFYTEPQVGDAFNVTAMKGIQIGWNESVVQQLWVGLIVDITLSGVIPEFPSTFALVVGLLCLVLLVSSPWKRPQC